MMLATPPPVPTNSSGLSVAAPAREAQWQAWHRGAAGRSGFYPTGHVAITWPSGALVRRGALLDLGATGWTAAVPTIRAAAVEPSLKLVALRGLAETSGDSQVLDVMDALL